MDRFGLDLTQTWEEFVAAIAASARIPAHSILPSSRLDDDLGLDSLALAEIIVLLIVDFDMETLGEGLEDRDWSGVTAGDLYREYCDERQARRV